MTQHLVVKKEGVFMSDEGMRLFERLVVLETKVESIDDQFKGHKEETSTRFSKIDDKLDAILKSLNRGGGMGAVLAVFGVAVVAGVISVVFNVFTGGK